MPILINELNTEILESPEENEVHQDQPGMTNIASEWLRINQLLKERLARLEDD